MASVIDPGFDTLALHAGQQPDPATGASVRPLAEASFMASGSPAAGRGLGLWREAGHGG